MADALTAPFATAALVLCIAGLAKLRSPEGAVRALATLGPPGGRALVRGFALLELALGGLCLLAPGRVAAGALACMYAMFSALALLLARRRSSCGCFGERQAPASIAQATLSLLLAAVALAAAITPAHGIGWTLGRPLVPLAVLIIGTAGAVYGTVLAYTELPRAWGAWSER